MKHILVVGVRSKTASDLKRKYGKQIKFTWVTDQGSQSKLNRGNYDVVILCVKFCRHTSQNLYRNHPCLIRINGGQTDLFSAIEDCC